MYREGRVLFESDNFLNPRPRFMAHQRADSGPPLLAPGIWGLSSTRDRTHSLLLQ